MNLDSLFDNLLTSGIGITHPETIRRIRVLNLFHLTFIMAAPLLGLFYFYVGAIPLFHTAVVAGFIMILSMVLLRKKKNLVWCNNLAIFLVWATLFSIVWNTGAITVEGVINPALILNAGLILLAIFVGGYVWGTVWTIIVFLETGFIVYLYLARFEFPNLIPYQISAQYHMGTYLLALLMMLLFAFLFEREKEEALLREQGKSAALRESNKYIDDILERSPVATFIIDRNHRVVQWNLACQEMTGVPAGDILGKGICDSLRMEEGESIADMVLEKPDSISDSYVESVISKTESGWYKLDIILPKLKEGQRSIVTAAPILDDMGMIRGAIQTVQEVKPPTVGKGLPEGLAWEQANEAFLSPVFKVDAQGKINFWNRACEENFGYAATEMIGQSAFDLVSKKYRALFKEALTKAFRGEVLESNTWKYYDRKGTAVYVVTRMVAVGGQNGKERECIVVNANITEQSLRMKKLELYAAEHKEK